MTELKQTAAIVTDKEINLLIEYHEMRASEAEATGYFGSEKYHDDRLTYLKAVLAEIR